jgi:hypothetical protein
LGVEGREDAGQRPVSSVERSCLQRIALTLDTVGLFPMTHHVECVALPGERQLNGSARETSASRRVRCLRRKVRSRVY